MVPQPESQPPSPLAKSLGERTTVFRGLSPRVNRAEEVAEIQAICTWNGLCCKRISEAMKKYEFTLQAQEGLSYVNLKR